MQTKQCKLEAQKQNKVPCCQNNHQQSHESLLDTIGISWLSCNGHVCCVTLFVADIYFDRLNIDLFWSSWGGSTEWGSFWSCKDHPTIGSSRPNWITGPGPKSGSAGKWESRGPENGVSRWWRPNSDIYSQNYYFALVYDVIYQFLGMEAKNYKFGMFCQQCYPSVAPGDADIRPRNGPRIHTCHLFTL